MSTCLVGTNLHAEVLCGKNWIVIANRPSTWGWRTLVPRPIARGLSPHWTQCRGPTPGIPPVRGRASGSRPGPAPVEKHETLGPYKLFNCYVDRAGVPHATAQFESSCFLLSPRPQTNTCAYPIVRLYVSYSNVRSRKNVMVQLHAPQGSRVVEN